MDKDRTADSAARDRGVPLTESQRAKRESLADVIPPPPEDEAREAPAPPA